MKKIFTFIAAVLASFSAFAQSASWSASQLPTAEEAEAAGYKSYWGYATGYGLPKDYSLINTDDLEVSVATENSLVTSGNAKYSAYKDYAYKLIIGTSQSRDNQVDATSFVDGIYDETGAALLPILFTSDNTNTEKSWTVTSGILYVKVKSSNYGSISLKYNRGGNNCAIFVVDKTKSRVVLQSTVRGYDDSHAYTHTAKFGVEPGHEYYISATDRNSVELYSVDYKECSVDDYTIMANESNSTDLWTASQLPTAVEAEAAGYNSYWGYATGYGLPKDYSMIKSDNIEVSVPTENTIVYSGSSKFSGYKDYSYKLIIGTNQDRDKQVDATSFVDGIYDETGAVLLPILFTNNNTNTEKSWTGTYGILYVNVPTSSTYGRCILNYNRGGNNSAIYVVDKTKSRVVLQSTTRCPDDAVKTHAAIFNVEPGHEYYISATEKNSVEFYAFGFCSTDSEKYNALNVTNTDAIAAPVATSVSAKSGKFIENGKIVVYSNGKKYNVNGVIVK